MLSEEKISETINEKELKTNLVTENIQESPQLKLIYKIIQLILLSLITIGPYINSYGTGSIKEDFKSTFNLKDHQYNLIQSLSNILSSITPFIGGIISDRISMRKSIFAFSIFCAVGYIIQAIGIYKLNIAVYAIGNCIGFSFANCIFVLTGPILLRYFDIKYYGFTISIILINLKLADFIASWTFPPIYEISYKLYQPYLIGLSFVLMAIIFTAIFCYLDRKFENKELLKKLVVNKFQLKDIKQFNLNYWILCVCGTIGLSAFYSFYLNSQTLLTKVYHFDRVQAGKLYSIPFTISLFQPVLGLIIDRFSNKYLLLTISGFFSLIGFTTWFICDLQENLNYQIVCIFGYIFLGLFLGTFTSILWICISICTTQRGVINTAYGFLVSVKSLGVALTTYLISFAYEYKGSSGSLLFGLVQSAVCVFLCLFLIFYNKNKSLKIFQDAKV